MAVFRWWVQYAMPRHTAALTYDQRRQRIKEYQTWINYWEREQRLIDSKFLDVDIADLQAWINVLKGETEGELGHKRTKSTAV